MEEEKIFERRWQLASNEQKARYKNLISSYPAVDWSYKEKKYLLWLCQLDIDTFETFEVILDKIKHSNEKRANIKDPLFFILLLQYELILAYQL